MKKTIGWIIFVFGVIGILWRVAVSFSDGIIGVKDVVEMIPWILPIMVGWKLADMGGATESTPPNLTAQQARGIVLAATKASIPTIQQAAWAEAKFNSSIRHWMVTVWNSEEDSNTGSGNVYIVDDATGKVLNPPPVYIPK